MDIYFCYSATINWENYVDLLFSIFPKHTNENITKTLGWQLSGEMAFGTVTKSLFAMLELHSRVPVLRTSPSIPIQPLDNMQPRMQEVMPTALGLCHPSERPRLALSQVSGCCIPTCYRHLADIAALDGSPCLCLLFK